MEVPAYKWNWILLVVTLLNVQSATSSLRLLLATGSDVRILEVENHHRNESFNVGVQDDDIVGDVDFLYSDNMIFWTNLDQEAIYRLVLDDPGKTIEPVITTRLLSPDGLACDWVGRHLYWVDSETKRIEVSELNGINQKVLYWQGIDQPRGVVLDPYKGYMFWSDWGEIPKIECAGMDGSHESRVVIVSYNIAWPNGLTIDLVETRLYWSDAKLGYIHSCDYFGESRTVVTDTGIHHPFSLTLYNEVLYWTDWETSSVQFYNTTSGDRGVAERFNGARVNGIRAFMESRQPTVSSPCNTIETNNCSHLCLISSTEPFYQCACPTGIALQSDMKTCNNGSEALLVFIRRTDIRKISLDTPDYTDVVLPVHNISHAIAVDIDPLEGRVYWTDDDNVGIKRARLDGTDQQTIVSDYISHPDGIALDLVARNLYWTDTGTDTIEVVRLNGASRKIIISDNLDEPRAVCLDPFRGYLYWTDWGDEPRIERANLDGSDRIRIVDTDLGWPNGLVCDLTDRKLFWVDAKTDRIEMANMDGSERRIVLDKGLPHVFGLSLLDDYLYWSDWQTRRIERANKTTGQNRTVILDQMPDLMSLKCARFPTTFKDTNECAVDNGGCSHLCLFTPNGARCACPDGEMLQYDDKNCRSLFGSLVFIQDDKIVKTWADDALAILTMRFRDFVRPERLDCDVKGGMIYWTDSDPLSLNTALIKRASMTGQGDTETILHTERTSILDIAVDWLAQNIYWIDYDRSTIEMARVNGSSKLIIVYKNLYKPKYMVLDPAQGLMYWSSASRHGRRQYQIERAYLDGSQRVVVISGIRALTAFTIDYDTSMLYWADKRVIEASKTDGTERRRIHTDRDSITSLTLYQHYLYWTSISRTGASTLMKMDKLSGKGQIKLLENLTLTTDLIAMHPSRQSGSNTCETNNGGCQRLCIARPRSSSVTHVCACPAHYSLAADGLTCTEPDSYLLISERNAVYRIMTDTNHTGAEVVTLLLTQINIRALEYDPRNKYIYWIDSRSKQIKRSSWSQESRSLIHRTLVWNENTTRPYDIALDPYSNTLFWSCVKQNTIQFTRVGVNGDVKANGTVINRGRPRYIALYPHKGELYWTSVDSPPSVLKSLYDGRNQVSLVSKALVRPGPITVDVHSDQLFWTDLERNMIEVSNMAGADRRVIVQDRLIAGIVSLAVLNNEMYVMTKTEIKKFSIDKRSTPVPVIKHHYDRWLTDMHAVRMTDYSEVRQHPCFDNNNGCSHLCIVTSKHTARCSCPIDMFILQYPKTCKKPQECSSGMFSCKSGRVRCIPNQWRCDGISECEDQSDEEGCTHCNATRYSHFCRAGDYQSNAPINICNKAENMCTPLKHSTTLENYCYASYVMKAKINSVQVYVNGANVQLTSRKIFYKGEEHYKDVYGDPFIAPNSACGCDVSRQSSDEKMLIMGITEHYRNHVTYMARMSDEKEFRRDLRRIIKGYDCSQYSTSQIQYLGLNNSTGN